ncbi:MULTISPECIES: BrnT family toxin [Nostoc]|uniref:BrnT family toxin n=1 Tax=Nostoc paludosum FACHB-159 TaxID=2692908 RepID=A0ABR8K3E8_9NOSO|nr:MULTISPECIES: BrnT family toxin [Nostoc]MBD2677861.1 BrnT family toxin [Nostoc sp. FACHB-857]MBD2733963.1 BrnT family toxin [Nostoc paludosum FACHB-159]
MTKLLEQAIARVKQLPETEQDAIAALILKELEDYGEDRYIGIGLLDGRIVVIVYTEPGEEIVRIISLRKALSHERKRYDQYLKNRLG